MPVGSTTAKNALLTATVGDARAASIPATFYLSFWNGDPTAGGVELSATGGYARIAVAWSTAVWGAPSAGQVKNQVIIDSAVSTAAFSAVITHIAFTDSATIGAGNVWDCGALDSSITVAAANVVVRFGVNGITIQVV